MKLLPLGTSNFKKLIEKNCYYADKTLLIKELLDTQTEVIIITRPRRFGKTLNMSMLQYFFEKSKESNSHLFIDKAIWQEEETYRALQGQYPIISLTFKDIKSETWEGAYRKTLDLIAHEFDRHNYLLHGTISSYAIAKFQSIIGQNADQSVIETSLSFLSELLYNHYGKRVIILIDEYDTPITTSYYYDYYDKMIIFMRSLLSGALKDNNFLERAIVTGILRIAKESILSGLNNIIVSSVTSTFFQDKFGFTQQEVKELLKDQKLSDKIVDVQEWYNGYMFGSETIYNPWSILQCAFERGLIKPYWLNTSDNLLIKKLITSAQEDVKADLELLMTGQAVTKEINEGIVFPNLERNDTALWSMLVFSGYLTYKKLEIIEGDVICDLAIPNKEVNRVYTSLVKDIFESSLTSNKITNILKSLTEGDAQTFAIILQEFIGNSMSSFDFSPTEPEKSYHLFVLGLLVYLSNTHEIKSNRESGNGRYDIMIIPKKPNQLGIVLEFKKVEPSESLELAANRALEQIKTKNYMQELKSRGIKKILLLGIAFQGKNLLLKAE